MSDEKLSVLLEAELQNALPCGLPCAAFRIENAAIERHSWFCPVLSRHHVRLLLARLERERSYALEEAANKVADYLRYSPEASGCVIAIRSLAPSVVSQPSRERTPHEEVIYQTGRLHGLTDAMTDLAMNKAREREVLEEVASALRGILDIGKRDMTNPKYDGYFEEAQRVLAALTATPASTGGTPR